MNISSSSSKACASSEVYGHNTVKTFILPDKCFETKSALAWRYGNKFSIYPRSQSRGEKLEAKCENKVINVRQGVTLFSPVLRKLVNESNGIYLNLQKIAEIAKQTESQLLKISRTYRSALRACLENLHEATAKESDAVEKNTLLSYITIIYSIECIWHLCEILYVDNIPGDVVLPFLLEWVRFHFPCHDQTAAQLLENCEKGSETHEQYWDAVIGMVVQGRVDVVRALLKLHTNSETNEFKLVDNALRTMPMYTVYGGVSAGEFTVGWKHWQAECRSKLSSVSQQHLQLILRLIVGDYAAFEAVRDRYESWYDLLGGWVMYTGPWAKRYELAEYAHACAGMRTRNTARKHLDIIVLATCECDLHQVIHEIQNISDNGWIATHLIDLLFHCGKLQIMDSHQVDVANRLRDSLILEYGSLMFEHQSLWSIGLSYLAGCGIEGRRRAELLLERLPVRNEAQVLRIISEARKHDLHSVVQSVSACVSARHMSCGRASAALVWAVRARHSALAGAAAERILKGYVTSGVLPAMDLLLTLGSAMLLHNRALFLGKYCEFHRLYKNREFKNAGKLLVSLITSKIAPDYFWNTLLLDTLPLLESDEVIFSSSNTYEIMTSLELRPNTLDQEKAELLRLGLTRNLARSSLSAEDVEE